MPLVKISLLDHWEGERLRRLNLGVHEALVEALGIESWDFFSSGGLVSSGEVYISGI